MPLKPVTGTLLMPLKTTKDAEGLFEAGLALVRHPSASHRGWASRDLADHFFYLGAVHPEFAIPLQERFVRLKDDELSIFGFSLHTWLYLLQGAADACTETLIELLDSKHTSMANWVRRNMLAAIGTPLALSALAKSARAHKLVSECEDAGVEIPRRGAAKLRFTPWRRALRKKRYSGSLAKLVERQNPIGLQLDAVTDHPDESKIAWHYVSVATAQLEYIPVPSAERLHLVGPPRSCGWTLFCRIGRGGKCEYSSIKQDRLAMSRAADKELRKLRNDRSSDRGTAELLPFDDELVYCNGHVQMTEGVVGMVGGPPIGLYPNPKCPKCRRLMFHVLHAECGIRSYAEGFLGLFLCEDCEITACNATNWN